MTKQHAARTRTHTHTHTHTSSSEQRHELLHVAVAVERPLHPGTCALVVDDARLTRLDAHGSFLSLGLVSVLQERVLRLHCRSNCVLAGLGGGIQGQHHVGGRLDTIRRMRGPKVRGRRRRQGPKLGGRCLGAVHRRRDPCNCSIVAAHRFCADNMIE